MQELVNLGDMVWGGKEYPHTAYLSVLNPNTHKVVTMPESGRIPQEHAELLRMRLGL